MHSFKRLAHMLAPDATLRRTWQLAGGISAAMTALELEYPDNQRKRMIVRQPSALTLEREPEAASNEYQLLGLARALGIKAPAPLYFDRSGEIFGAPYLVIEYIDGAPQFAFADPHDAMLQAADQLAAIHRADLAGHDLSFLSKPPGAAALGVRAAEHERALAAATIHDVVEAARPLPSNAPALLHGDYWPGNILWRDGVLQAVIDWEDARLGDPLADLAISRLDIACIFGSTALETFTQRYRARMPLDYAGLPYWDLVAALRLSRMAGADLDAWAAFFDPWGRSDITAHTIREHYNAFTAQALAALMV